MDKQKQNSIWRAFVYLFIFLVLMLVFFSFFPDKLMISLTSSWNSFRQFLLIFPAIIILIGIFSVMVTPEMIAKNFGKETGFFGAVKALFFGSLMSTGPLYLAFPLAKNLLDKGAKNTDIIIFVSAWNGIGVIAELVELHFMGLLFMAIRCLLLVVFIILMGYAAGLILGRRE